jgi:hypothetical protein
MFGDFFGANGHAIFYIYDRLWVVLQMDSFTSKFLKRKEMIA